MRATKYLLALTIVSSIATFTCTDNTDSKIQPVTTASKQVHEVNIDDGWVELPQEKVIRASRNYRRAYLTDAPKLETSHKNKKSSKITTSSAVHPETPAETSKITKPKTPNLSAPRNLPPIHWTRTPISEAMLKKLRMCESSGRYNAVNKSGKYMGAYQFGQPTWNSNMKGTGWEGTKPNLAPPDVQDYAARILYSRRGGAPWPQCSVKIGLR